MASARPLFSRRMATLPGRSIFRQMSRVLSRSSIIGRELRQSPRFFAPPLEKFTHYRRGHRRREHGRRGRGELAALLDRPARHRIAEQPDSYFLGQALANMFGLARANRVRAFPSSCPAVHCCPCGAAREMEHLAHPHRGTVCIVLWQRLPRRISSRTDKRTSKRAIAWHIVAASRSLSQLAALDHRLTTRR